MTKEQSTAEMRYRLSKYVLQVLLDDDEVTEIMVNGYKDIFFAGRKLLSRTLLLGKDL